MSSVLRAYSRIALDFPMTFLTSFDNTRRDHSAGPFVAALARVGGARGHAITHVHLSHGGSLLREGLLAKLARVRHQAVVISLHGGEFPDFARRWPRLCGWVLEAADVILTLTPETAAVVRELRPSARTLPAHNPVDVSASGDPDAATPPRVLFVGDVTPRKGIDTLLTAWRRVTVLRPDAELVIIGPGDHGRDQEVPGVLWLGPRQHSDVLHWLSRSRVAVLPSRVEAQPVFLLEAMAVGRPFVATSVGCVPLWVEAGCGFGLDPGDTDTLVEHLHALLGDENLARRMGHRGRALVLTQHSFDAIARDLSSLYTEALAAAHARRGGA